MKVKEDEVKLLDGYFRALNYIGAGQMYLKDNPLLKRKLELSDIKEKVVGHWGTVPGQNFIYTHLNRIIKKYDLNMIYISGPGHGGNAPAAGTYLEKTYTETYPSITYDEEGLKKLFKQFSFPGGISSHAAPETPGSINEGGELGYSLSHAYGAVLDNPTLIAACVIGDGEAETGPLATSWHINKIINPKKDGIVLPILHLNGYKIANPTILSRISIGELKDYFRGCGYNPYVVSAGSDYDMHIKMINTLDKVVKDINDIKRGKTKLYPMVILKSKKGWSGPKLVLDKEIEGSFRSHQVPITIDDEKSLRILEKWFKSYKPEELFDKNGTLIPSLQKLIPSKTMGMNPNANGGLLLRELILPDYREYGIKVVSPGNTISSDMFELGKFIRDIIKLNKDNYRVFCPDELLSNRLSSIFEVTNRQWNSMIKSNDEYLDVSGRVIDSFLSEHVCEGMLEGYILTGRHGFITSYEAFARIIDSMVSQHAKWIKVSKELSWREDISSLNILLTSHIWQQDHNGYTHQDPGFINHIITKKADISRVYLPPDTNTLISCFNHISNTKNYINVIIASKHPSRQWLNMDEAIIHCTKGIGRWDFASSDQGDEVDIVMACIGDTPTLETIAATKILKEHFSFLRIRVINVVDLMKLQSNNKHPHGLTDEEYNSLFTVDKPVIFAFHGYPNVIHELTYKRVNRNIHVRGYKEEGTITTSFDMRVLNEIDRYHLVMLAIDNLKVLGEKGSYLKQICEDTLIRHKEYIREYGKDLDEVTNWRFE